ncbi:hypothetical protein MMC22_004993 [Lobaria immixta]|nr:hypothetical protein [Lobaria immixta]
MSGECQEMDGNDHDNLRVDDMSSASAVIDICARGDLLLHVKHYNDVGQLYRVSVAILRKASAYFDTLLNPNKFSEGAAIQSQLRELTRSHVDVASMPTSELPRVSISDFGHVPKAKISESAFKLFLDILHNVATSVSVPRTHFIAILALIADRFDAIGPISSYVINSGWKKKPAKQDKNRKSDLQLESLRRQKLLIGLSLGFQDWVHHYSSELIYQGSEKWMSGLVDDDGEAPWWYLPNGVEEELFHRRGCIFETVGSIQSHFLHLYSHTSQRPQCRLGYDSSWQCDSFQLGEMIRFFTRKGTLSMQNTFGKFQDASQYTGNVEDLLSILRQCPTYQIDKNHFHCGPRSGLEAALTSVVPSLSRTGICLHCWRHNRSEDSWAKNPTGGKWYLGMPRLKSVSKDCYDHRSIKAMCTADERDWTPPPA